MRATGRKRHGGAITSGSKETLMRNLIVPVIVALLAIPGLGLTSQDAGQPVSPNSICEFLPWLPGCDFFK